MKKVMLATIIILFLGLIPHVFAAAGDFVPLAPITGLTDNIPGVTDSTVAGSVGLATFFNNLYKYLVGLAAALAVIEIIWGGLEIALNKDDVSKLTDSKGKIYNAILGLILVLSPVLVFSIINPSILNLSLNLPPIKDVSKATTPSGGSPVTCSTSTSCKDYNECKIIVSASASCTSGWDTVATSCCGTLTSDQQCCARTTAVEKKVTCTIFANLPSVASGGEVTLTGSVKNAGSLTIMDNESNKYNVSIPPTTAAMDTGYSYARIVKPTVTTTYSGHATPKDSWNNPSVSCDQTATVTVN